MGARGLRIAKERGKMREIKLKKVDTETLELIYEIRRQIEMRFALSAELLGIDKEHPTAEKVKN